MKNRKRILPGILTALILMQFLTAAAPHTAMAASSPAPREFSFTYENPVFSGDGGAESEITFDLPDTAQRKLAVGGIYTEIEDVAIALRDALREHHTSFIAQIDIPGGGANPEAWMENLKALVLEMYRAAIRHTGVPNEGDYIKFHFGGLTASARNIVNDLGRFACTVVLDLEYYSTMEEEAQVNAETDRILRSLDLEGRTNYEKVRAIYSYICNNVSYDYGHLDDMEYARQFTAYAALMDHKAVCQGYANLFYMLALKAGVDNRIIGGEGGRPGMSYVPHAWNIVRIGNTWYNIDPTWDSETSTKEQYFLKSSLSFDARHIRDAEYETPAFLTRYPVSQTDHVPGTESAGSVTDISLSRYSRTVFLGDVIGTAGTATVYPASAVNRGVTFSANNTEALQQRGDDYVAMIPGTYDIIARSVDGGIESRCEVIVLNQSRYPDLKPHQFYTSAMLRAALDGIIGGTPEGLMLPDKGCTRAEALTMLWRSSGQPYTGYDISMFGDVGGTDYFAPAVSWALSGGITSGTSAQTFSPHDVCTREQIATFLWRMHGMPYMVDYVSAFSDMSTDRYSYQAVLWADRNGVVNGMGDNRFAPDEPCTRAQIVTMIDRARRAFGY